MSKMPATYAPPTSKTLYTLCVESDLLRRPERISDIISQNTAFIDENSARLARITESMTAEQASTSEGLQSIKNTLLEMEMLLEHIKRYSVLLTETKSKEELIACIRANPTYSLENLFPQFFKLRNDLSNAFQKLESALTHAGSEGTSQAALVNVKRLQGSPDLFKRSHGDTEITTAASNTQIGTSKETGDYPIAGIIQHCA